MAKALNSWQIKDQQIHFKKIYILLIIIILLLSPGKQLVQPLPIGLKYLDYLIINKFNSTKINETIDKLLFQHINQTTESSINYYNIDNNNNNTDINDHHIFDEITSNINDSNLILSKTIVIDLHEVNEVNHSKTLFAFEILLRIITFVYCCLVIGYLCDEYFVPSLSSIGQTLNLREDLIGALLIPFGTSGPEIFSSAVGVFFTENDIGTGAIIGSGVFNILAIPAACGLAATYFLGKSIQLEKCAILRDLTFYFISIIVLILAVKDNAVDFIDSLLFTILFVVYIFVMFYRAPNNDNDNNDNDNNDNDNNDDDDDDEFINEQQQLIIDNYHQQQNFIKQQQNNNGKNFLNNYLNKLFNNNNNQNQNNQNNQQHEQHVFELFIEEIIYQEKKSKKSDYEQLNDDDNGVGFTNNIILRILLMPFIIVYSITMPSRFPIVTFFLSIAWLSILSYATVWSISGLSDMIGIPSTISGMTILAAGSAVPDLVTSIIVIKKTGHASMGICAAIASNIFAILLGLGLPWAIRFTLNWMKTGKYQLSLIALQSNALPYTLMLLLLIIAILYLTFQKCQWKVSKNFSFICFILHILFIVCSLFLEISIS